MYAFAYAVLIFWAAYTAEDERLRGLRAQLTFWAAYTAEDQLKP